MFLFINIFRIKITHIFGMFLIFQLSFGQSYDCNNGKFRDFNTYQVQSLGTEVYSRTTSLEGQNQALGLDVFGPVADNLPLRPLILIFHGGSFSEGTRQEEEPTARQFASLGYVTATVSYRLGINPKGAIDGSLDSVVATEALVMAVQDMNTAVRWFRKNAVENGNPYKIDTSLIFAIGISSGAIIVNHTQYMDTESKLPIFIDMNKPALREGGLTSNNIERDNYSTQIKAMASLSGALLETSWIKSSGTPMTLFHGRDDQIVPFASDVISVLDIPLLSVHGSYTISQSAQSSGLKHCWHEWAGSEGSGHVYPSTAAETVALNGSRNFFGHFTCGVLLECDGNLELPTEPDPNLNTVLKNNLSKIKISNTAESKYLSFRIPTRFSNGNFKIYDLRGGLIYLKKELNKSVKVETNLFSPGIYLVQMSNGTEIFSSHFLYNK